MTTTSQPISAAPPTWVIRAAQITAVALLIFLTVQGCTLYNRHSSYNEGAAALERGDWPAAQARLWQVFRGDPKFRNVVGLLLESYYRPATAAIAARDWPAAAAAIVVLESLDPAYRDIEEYTGGAHPELEAALLEARMGAWHGGTLRLQRSLGGEESDALGVSPDGRTLVISEGSDLQIWQDGGSQPRRVTGGFDYISDIEFSPDGALLATAGVLGGVQLRSPDGAPLGAQLASGATQVAFSPDGTMVAGATMDGRVDLYRLEDRGLVRSFEIDSESGGFAELAFSPDGELLIAAGASKSIDTEADKLFVWRVSDGDLRWSAFQTFGALAMAVSPDGEQVAVGNGFGEVTVYRLSDGEHVWRARDHTAIVRKREGRRYEDVPVNGVLALRYSADGSLLATGGVQGLIIYDAEGEQLQWVEREAGAGLPVDLFFAAAGQPLLSLAYEQEVQFWRAAPPAAAP
jgi:hypothetical protein